MKKILFVLAFLTFLGSCSKEKDVSSDLPQWLRERIASDEKEIAAEPNSDKDLGAWIAYTYYDSTYFEYHNLIMSSLPKVYYYSGTEMDFSQPVYTEYQSGKCCKKFIWKGKGYIID